MTKFRTAAVTAVVVACALSASAQTPPRPNESPRAVTLSLNEYNRLIDLASRPPEPAVAPIAAVLASADLRVRVEGDTARGAFTLVGDVLRAGVSRVSLMSGATLIEANVAGRPVPLMSEGQSQTALLPGPGPFSLSLEWGAPLKFAPVSRGVSRQTSRRRFWRRLRLVLSPIGDSIFFQQPGCGSESGR